MTIPSLRDLRGVRNMLEEAYEEIRFVDAERFPKAYEARGSIAIALVLIRQEIEEKEKYYS